MDERPTKRRGLLLWLADRTWRFWVVVLVILPALYVASFGPACWWFAKSVRAVPGGPNFGRNAAYLSKFYWPIGWTLERGPLLKPILAGYSKMCGDRTGVVVPSEPYGTGGMILWLESP